VLLFYSLGVALLIWGLSALQLYLRRFPPAQLRPALAIHLSPAAMVGQGAFLCGYTGLGESFFWVSAAIVVALVVNVRWITEHGFSPFWGAFTFPAVGFAGLSFAASGLFGWVMLVAATAITLYVLVRVLRLWYIGKLATLTFAARPSNLISGSYQPPLLFIRSGGNPESMAM
jgi:tellurite resistance protein